MKKLLLVSAIAGLVSTAHANHGHFYAGPFVGMGVTQGKFTSSNDTSTITRDNHIGQNSFLGGLLVGYAYPCNHLFMGFELLGNFDATDSKIISEGAPPFETFKLKRKASYGFSAQFGYRTNSDAVMFIRLGGEWSNMKLSYAGSDVNGALDASNKKTKFSFVPGLGIEAPINCKWRARLEAKYSLPQKISMRIGSQPAAVLNFENTDTRARTGQTSVIVGVTYSFG